MRRVWINLVILSVALGVQLCAQPGRGPGPPNDPRSIQRRIEDTRRRLDDNPPVSAEERELAAFVRKYLGEAQRSLAAGRLFQADRLADASDACGRLIGRPPGPPGGGRRGPPPPEDHLRQVYFRLRLSDFFLQQIPGPQPKRLLEMARTYYERAVKAKESGNASAAEEYARNADDLTHALESLAQAYVEEAPKLP